MPILFEQKVFNLYHFQRENEFENLVENLSDKIFGNTSIYIGKKRKMKGAEIISIPDGYLIDMTIIDEPKLFIIENEIVSHDPFKHIGIQLLKFATSFDDGKVELKNYLMDIISNDKQKLKRLEHACSKSKHRNIDNYLDSAVYDDFKAIVLIDEARDELHNVIQKINANISVLELKAYIDEKGNFLYQYDTLYDEEDIIEQNEEKTNNKSNKKRDYDYEAIQKSVLRRAECDTIVVPAREEGFATEFIGNNQWYAIRIGAAMKDRIKYIAAYQVAPISAITHIAEIDTIAPYKKTGKYILKFKGPAREITPIKTINIDKKPQGPIYIKYENLVKANSIDELMEY